MSSHVPTAPGADYRRAASLFGLAKSTELGAKWLDHRGYATRSSTELKITPKHSLEAKVIDAVLDQTVSFPEYAIMSKTKNDRTKMIKQS